MIAVLASRDFVSILDGYTPDPIKNEFAVDGQGQETDFVNRCSRMDLGDEIDHALFVVRRPSTTRYSC